MRAFLTAIYFCVAVGIIMMSVAPWEYPFNINTVQVRFGDDNSTRNLMPWQITKACRYRKCFVITLYDQAGGYGLNGMRGRPYGPTFSERQDATQSNAALQPTSKIDANLGGRPVIDFNGTQSLYSR